MMWTRIPGDNMFADPCMEYAGVPTLTDADLAFMWREDE